MAAETQRREGLRFPPAIGLAMLIVLAVAGACMAVVSNLFDGGTDEGNRIVAVLAGLFTAGLTLVAFVRGGLPAPKGMAAIALGWALAAGLVYALFLVAWAIGCSDGDCS